MSSTILQPGMSNPLLWVLSYLFALSDAEIQRRSGVPRTQILRARRGDSVSPPTAARLRALVLECRTEIGAHVVEFHRQHPLIPDDYADFRKALWSVVRRVLDAPDNREIRRTPTRELLLRVLGRGRPRKKVIKLMRPLTPATTKRAARELGLVEVVRDDEIWWVLPTHTPVLKESTRLKLTTPRLRRCYDALAKYLSKIPTDPQGYGWALARDVEQYLADLGFQRQLVYRTLARVLIPRRTVGFGAAKRTFWSLPSIKKSRVTVDFEDSLSRRPPSDTLLPL